MSRKHEWVLETGSPHCSECGFEIDNDQISYHYCPNCGDMKGHYVNIRENPEIIEKFYQLFDEVHVYNSDTLESIDAYTSFEGLNRIVINAMETSSKRYTTNVEVYTNGDTETNDKLKNLTNDTDDFNCYVVANDMTISNATFIVIFNNDKNYSMLVCTECLTDKDIDRIYNSIDEHNEESVDEDINDGCC